MTDQQIRKALFLALPSGKADLEAFAAGDATAVLNALVPVVARLVAQAEQRGFERGIAEPMELYEPEDTR